MINTTKSLLLFLILCLSGCATQPIITSWKADSIEYKLHKQILVVAILPSHDSLARYRIEQTVVNELEAIGYPALSAQWYFGSAGLKESTEEKTYMRLCSIGIDAVFTIAVLPHTKETLHQEIASLLLPHNYYYARIWHYKQLVSSVDSSKKIYWESILFDLATLEAQTVLRSRPEMMDSSHLYTNLPIVQFVKKMQREKILVTGEPLRPAKAF